MLWYKEIKLHDHDIRATKLTNTEALRVKSSLTCCVKKLIVKINCKEDATEVFISLRGMS